MLLAEGRLLECWIPPGHILEYRALLETYHDLRAEHTAWVQRIHAVLFHHGAPALGEGVLRTEQGVAALRAAAAAHLSPAGHPRSGRRPVSARPSAPPYPQTQNDPKPHSWASWATPTLACPSPTAGPSSIAAPSSPADTILLTCHQARPAAMRQTS